MTTIHYTRTVLIKIESYPPVIPCFNIFYKQTLIFHHEHLLIFLLHNTIHILFVYITFSQQTKTSFHFIFFG